MFITRLFCLCYASLCECDVLSMYTDILVLEICFLIYWHGFYRPASVPPPAALAHAAHLGALIEGREKGDQCLWVNQETLWICVLFSLRSPFFHFRRSTWSQATPSLCDSACPGIWSVKMSVHSCWKPIWLRYFPLFTSIISLLLFTFCFFFIRFQTRIRSEIILILFHLFLKSFFHFETSYVKIFYHHQNCFPNILAWLFVRYIFQVTSVIQLNASFTAENPSNLFTLVCTHLRMHRKLELWCSHHFK